MTKNANTDARDRVLLAFHQAHERPSAEDIIEWTEKYPAFAEDIRVHAAILRDWAAQDDITHQIPTELALTQARSRALSELHAARKESGSDKSTAAMSFDAMISAKGTNIPQLARHFDIDRGVLADMISGMMLAPIGERLVSAWTAFFTVSRDMFEKALLLAQENPRLGHANSNGPPQIRRRPYENIVRSSSMSEERIRYWLGED
jgi:hypothetical protein